MQLIHRVLVSGLIAGFTVLGVGGRIAMRFIGIAEGKSPTFTIGGTFAVFLIFGVFGIILSVPFAALQGYLSSSSLRKGATFGLLLTLMIVWAMPLLALDADGLNFASIVGRVLFSALFLGYGLTVATVSAWLDNA